jgi:hypothetical protein
MNNVIMWATSVITVGGALAVLWKIFTPLIKKTKDLSDTLSLFLRDWNGEEPSLGRDRTPGVMERLNRIDGELQHNSGSSMKDSLKRIESTLKKIDERLIDGDNRFKEVESRIEDIEKRL